MPTSRWLTTAQYAERTGTPVHNVRAALRAGMLPGAIRVGGVRSEWRIPDPDDLLRDHETPALDRAGARGSRHSRGCAGDDVTSPRGDTLTIARHVSQALGAVTTRPARAAADLVHGLVLIRHAAEVAAARHYAGRDGWCVACSTEYPCADATAYAGLVDLTASTAAHAADQVLGGAQ